MTDTAVRRRLSENYKQFSPVAGREVPARGVTPNKRFAWGSTLASDGYTCCVRLKTTEDFTVSPQYREDLQPSPSPAFPISSHHLHHRDPACLSHTGERPLRQSTPANDVGSFSSPVGNSDQSTDLKVRIQFQKLALS
ncbi:hypothetical protein BaRGS_00000330 [Batillaria attramentaria]|uniref:Uncharacterized protein n=1 Tax=Batillaria attramentaria TaxID=370345 RepID=A0ABD0M9H9_9CAEN